MQGSTVFTYANTTAPVFYHALGPGHDQFYRLVRLRALAQSPSVFGSTFQREVAFTPETWTGRLANPHQVTFIACNGPSVDTLALPSGSDTWNQPDEFETSDQLIHGMITCIRSFDDPMNARIVGFWVSPGMRHQGVGNALIEKVLSWARRRVEEEKFESVVLDVRRDNSAARGLYERCGFKPAGTNPDDSVEIRYIFKLL